MRPQVLYLFEGRNLLQFQLILCLFPVDQEFSAVEVHYSMHPIIKRQFQAKSFQNFA